VTAAEGALERLPGCRIDDPRGLRAPRFEIVRRGERLAVDHECDADRDRSITDNLFVRLILYSYLSGGDLDAFSRRVGWSLDRTLGAVLVMAALRRISADFTHGMSALDRADCLGVSYKL